MGVSKGIDNFKGHRTEKQKRMLELLRSELEKARRRKMVYPNKSTLVADMEDRTKIHRTTLIRNDLYSSEILAFLIRQAGGSTFLADEDATPEMLRAKLIDAQMEIGHLRNQLATASETLQPKQTALVPSGTLLTESVAHAAFADTVWVLRELIERLNIDGVVFEIDMDRCELRDLSAAPGRHVVVVGQRVKPFINAYRRLLQQEGKKCL